MLVKLLGLFLGRIKRPRVALASATIGTFLLPGFALAGEPPVKYFNQAYEQCLKTQDSSYAVSICIDQETQMWDYELNRQYLELMRVLPDPAKNKLRQAQREWLKFRDSEFALIEQMSTRFMGPRAALEDAASKRELVKKRAMELHSYNAEIDFNPWPWGNLRLYARSVGA